MVWRARTPVRPLPPERAAVAATAMYAAVGGCAALAVHLWPELFSGNLARLGLVLVLFLVVLWPGTIPMRRLLEPRVEPPPYETVPRWRHMLCYAPTLVVFWAAGQWFLREHREASFLEVHTIVLSVFAGVVLAWVSYPWMVEKDRLALDLPERWDDD